MYIKASSVLLLLLTVFPVQAVEYLNVSLLLFNGTQRTAYYEQFEAFSERYPHIKLVIKDYEAEKYKSSFSDWLRQDRHSDVMYWFSGEKLRRFVSEGLVLPLNDKWQGATASQTGWSQQFSQGSKSSVTFEQSQYGLPVHYYPWAIYYKKSLFKRYGIAEPTDWDSFLSACNKLKEAGITPVTIGSKNHWTLAAWFDYLNLRINGLEFHRKLVSGQVSYQSAKVRAVFRYWQRMVESGYFLDEHEKYTWREALPFLYRNMAGMMLMGNFWTSQIPPSLAHDIGMFRFPRINADAGLAEEAPTNVWIIPENVQNQSAAMLFLDFMAQPDVQQELNNAVGMLSPHLEAVAQEDYFLRVGASILNQAEGVSQFYDRDNPHPIASEGLKQFSRFVVKPKSLDRVLLELEKLREKSF